MVIENKWLVVCNDQILDGSNDLMAALMMVVRYWGDGSVRVGVMERENYKAAVLGRLEAMARLDELRKAGFGPGSQEV